jgi:hypothetical protein
VPEQQEIPVLKEIQVLKVLWDHRVHKVLQELKEL